MLSAHERTDLYTKAVDFIAASLNTNREPSRLFGPNGRPLAPSSAYNYQRTAAKRTGSMKGWVPKRVTSKQAGAIQRETIVARSVDLVENDPHAAGVVDTFASTVIGSGLVPMPNIMTDLLDIEKETARAIQRKQRAVYEAWQPTADAGGRMSFGNMQYVIERNIVEYGEYLMVFHMIEDLTRPYMLACGLLNPQRLKTPADMVSNTKVIDGIEIGDHSEAVAYWIKKSDNAGPLADISKNFLRIPAKDNHRYKVLHGFFNQDSERVRGIPFLAPAMKWFKDLNDFLDAELMSNIVTSAFALFIEATESGNPFDVADLMKNRVDGITDADGNAEEIRYEEIQPGTIMYGSAGQKPHPIAASRPGVTFEPFTRTIMKAISVSMGIPYAVLFKDPENLSFAGFRSAMLDAWRVYSMHRKIAGQTFCQIPYAMLQEEAWLMGQIPEIEDFYTQMWAVTRCDWRGTPKGDIEPVKAVKADVQANAANQKTLEKIISESGEDYESTLDQLADERDDLESRRLSAGGPANARGGETDPPAEGSTEDEASAVTIDEASAEMIADKIAEAIDDGRAVA